MKKFIIILTLTITIFIPSYSQTVVDTSNDTHLQILGENYIVHTLKKGEALYSLSKVYHSPLDQIIAHNNFSKKIHHGQIIKIPVIDENYTFKSLIDTTICCLYKTKRHETIYSIARKFNISPELLIEYNPQIKEKGIKPRKYLRIPQINLPRDIEDDYFIYHPYKKGETAELLALYYSVPVKDILQFNSTDDFSFGKIIAIPKKHYNPDQESILKADYLRLPDLTGLEALNYLFPTNPPCKTFRYNPQQSFNIALLLPLFITENQANLQEVSGNTFRLYDRTNIFYEYLFGTLIAIDELRQLGININLHIYDTRRDSTRIKNILDRPEFQDMDLVIGPVYSYNYPIVRKAAYRYKINFVSPLSRNEEILINNPFVFMTIPSDSMFMKRIAQFIAPSCDTSKIIILTEFSDYSEKLSNTLMREIKRQAWELKGLDTIDIEQTYYDPTEQLDANILSETKHNYIIIPSKNEVFVDGALNQLNSIKSIKAYKISVIGLPNWTNFKNFDLKWYINLKIYYPSFFFLDKDNPAVKQFITKYMQTFNTLPSYYSYLGYDITNYFAHALKQYGRTFQFCLSPYDMEPNPRGIYLNFNFRRLDQYSGFENNAVFMIYYDENLKMHKIENLNQEY